MFILSDLNVAAREAELLAEDVTRAEIMSSLKPANSVNYGPITHQYSKKFHWYHYGVNIASTTLLLLILSLTWGFIWAWLDIVLKHSRIKHIIPGEYFSKDNTSVKIFRTIFLLIMVFIIFIHRITMDQHNKIFDHVPAEEGAYGNRNEFILMLLPIVGTAISWYIMKCIIEYFKLDERPYFGVIASIAVEVAAFVIFIYIEIYTSPMNPIDRYYKEAYLPAKAQEYNIHDEEKLREFLALRTHILQKAAK